MTTFNQRITMLLAFALFAIISAAEAREKPVATQKTSPAESKPAKPASKTDGGSNPNANYKSAATVDFSVELGLSFPSLVTLGSRIELFRSTTPDPFGLASAASELATAEKLSGGNASITSEQLMSEAVEMARVRNDSSELKAVAIIVGNEKVQKELTDLAARAERDENRRSEQTKTGIVTRGIVSELIVDNDSHQFVKIYYNRRYVGTLKPHGHRHIKIHDHSPFYDLYARGSFGTIWKRHLHGDRKNYTWKLFSNRKPIVRLPSRVRKLHTHVKGHHVDVEWLKAINAVAYEVQIYNKTTGQPMRKLWKRGLRATEMHFDAPHHDSVYQIYVRGINKAGLPNDSASLWSRTEVLVR
jgi:hypothetical protein